MLKLFTPTFFAVRTVTYKNKFTIRCHYGYLKLTTKVTAFEERKGKVQKNSPEMKSYQQHSWTNHIAKNFDLPSFFPFKLTNPTVWTLLLNHEPTASIIR
jgi:hypothetical protein